jgi:hypothetical protein
MLTMGERLLPTVGDTTLLHRSQKEQQPWANLQQGPMLPVLLVTDEYLELVGGEGKLLLQPDRGKPLRRVGDLLLPMLSRDLLSHLHPVEVHPR